MLPAGMHIRQGAAAADFALWQMYELSVLGSPSGKNRRRQDC